MAASDRPDSIVHWSEIEGADNSHYPGDDELMGIGSPFGAHFGLRRLGIHHIRLLPGRRTSYPHAERTEEEFVYVLAGEPDVWLDGELFKLHAGDGLGFPPGTGLCHTFINNTDAEVCLLVVGDTAVPITRSCTPSTRTERTTGRTYGPMVRCGHLVVMMVYQMRYALADRDNPLTGVSF